MSSTITRAQASIDKIAADENLSVGRADHHQLPPKSESAWQAYVELVAALDDCVSGELGPSLESAPQDELRLGRFLIRGELGRGGFGIVLQAFDPLLDREVALKLPHPARLLTGHSAIRCLAEAQASAALVHPGIIRVYETGRIGPIWYIVSEFCEGPALSGWLAEHAPVPIRVAAELIAQVADAVQHAHSRGILHRDLKPANILLRVSEDGRLIPQVGDFGLASRSPDSGDIPSRAGMAGTIAYMAPEQTWDDQSRVGIEADVYALGVILFELLTARLPFAAENDTELVERIRGVSAPHLRTIRNDAPRDVDAICAKCLAKDPAERYESAAYLCRDLRRFLAGDCVAARPVGLPHRTVRWCKRRPVAASLAVALVVAVVCGAAVSLRQWLRAEENLRQAEAAVVNLGWAIDDAVFWQHDNDRYGPEQRRELTRRYAILLEQLRGRPAATQVKAASDCFFARLDVLDGKPGTAKEKFISSITGWIELVRNDPSDMFNRRSLAKTLYCYGTFLLAVDNDADGMHRFDGNRLFGYLVVGEHVGQTVIFDYADILYEKAESLREKNRDFDAARHYSACIDICRHLSAGNPRAAEFRFRMLQSLVRLDAVHRPGASREAAYKTRMDVVTGLRELVRRFPERNDFRLECARVAAWLATHAENRGQVAEVDSLLTEAQTTLEVVLARRDCPAEAKREYGDILRFLALRRLDLNQPAAAMQCAGESLRWYDMAELEGAIGALPHARACRLVGGIYLDCGAESEAIAAFERAIKLYEAACGGAARSRSVHLQHADVWTKLTSLYERSGRSDEALETSKQAVYALEAWRGPTPAEPHVALQLRRLRSSASRLEATDNERL